MWGDFQSTVRPALVPLFVGLIAGGGCSSSSTLPDATADTTDAAISDAGAGADSDAGPESDTIDAGFPPSMNCEDAVKARIGLSCDTCNLDAYYPVCIRLDADGCPVEFEDGAPPDFEPSAPDVEWTEETVACLHEKAAKGRLRCRPELANRTIEDDTNSCTI